MAVCDLQINSLDAILTVLHWIWRVVFSCLYTCAWHFHYPVLHCICQAFTRTVTGKKSKKVNTLASVVSLLFWIFCGGNLSLHLNNTNLSCVSHIAIFSAIPFFKALLWLAIFNYFKWLLHAVELCFMQQILVTLWHLCNVRQEHLTQCGILVS